MNSFNVYLGVTQHSFEILYLDSDNLKGFWTLIDRGTRYEAGQMSSNTTPIQDGLSGICGKNFEGEHQCYTYMVGGHLINLRVKLLEDEEHSLQIALDLEKVGSIFEDHCGLSKGYYLCLSEQ